MNDQEIAEFITDLVKHTVRDNLDSYSIEIFKDGGIGLLFKEQASQYRLRQDNAIAVEIPKLSNDNGTAIAQLALVIGRRLERFERGLKANANRTAETRQEIAQKAIQSRWKA